jgi:hypothetical protein
MKHHAYYDNTQLLYLADNLLLGGTDSTNQKIK